MPRCGPGHTCGVSRTQGAGAARAVPREVNPMKRFTRIITVSAVILGITFVGSNVAARNVSSDQAALTPARISADQGVEKKVDALLARMTADEKLQQVQLLSDGQIT